MEYKTKILIVKNRSLFLVILKDPNDVSESIITLYSISISKEKIVQVISVVLSNITKKDFEGSVQVVPKLG